MKKSQTATTPPPRPAQNALRSAALRAFVAALSAFFWALRSSAWRRFASFVQPGVFAMAAVSSSSVIAPELRSCAPPSLRRAMLQSGLGKSS